MGWEQKLLPLEYIRVMFVADQDFFMAIVDIFPEALPSFRQLALNGHAVSYAKQVPLDPVATYTTYDEC